MNKNKKNKRPYLHPITGYIILIAIVILLSYVLSLFDFSATYSSINTATNELEQTIVEVKNMLSYDGMKEIISNAASNFISFSTLSSLIITLIGIGIAQVTGLLQAVMNKKLAKINPKIITFLLFLLAAFSSIVNEVGYTVLIPLGALLFLFNGRNPLAGIATAFAGVAFGYGISCFVGTIDISLLPYTIRAAHLIDSDIYVKMTSNLYIMIASCIIISIVGTFVTEKYIVKKFGRYVSKTKDDLGNTKEIEYLDLQYEEQKKIMEETKQKVGLKYALIAAIVVGFIFIYMIIPNLPLSGILLDTSEEAYAYQLFGENSYFQAGFTYILAIFFGVTGIAYGIGAKTIKSDRELFSRLGEELSKIGELLVTLFFATQFIAIFRATNIGTVIVSLLTNLLRNLPLSGLMLIIVAMLIIAISNIFVTSSLTKWTIISPVLVPMMMQLNMSPAFAQIVFRAAESMTNGITPLLTYFVIYIGYLNIYNKDSDKSYGIRRGLSMMVPYFIALLITWLLIIIIWYIIGLPLGPSSHINL